MGRKDDGIVGIVILLVFGVFIAMWKVLEAIYLAIKNGIKDGDLATKQKEK